MQDKKTNRFGALEAVVEKIEMPKTMIDPEAIESIIKKSKEAVEHVKIKVLTVKLTEQEYKDMVMRKMQLSSSLTIQDYVSKLIRDDIFNSKMK